MVPFALIASCDRRSSARTRNRAHRRAGAFFFFRIALIRIDSFRDAIRSISAALGTWLWTNIVMGGAWQLALGFAMIGELAAIYYVFAHPRPFLAGLFFAFAFGNRTEVIITAPVFIFSAPARLRHRNFAFRVSRTLTRVLRVPLLLGIATLLYNVRAFRFAVRFRSGASARRA